MTITASSRHRSDYPVKAATNATRVGFIESDGVVVIFGAGQQGGDSRAERNVTAKK
jgi:hypothetical protein